MVSADDDLTLAQRIAKARVMHSFLPDDDERTKNEYVADELEAAGYRLPTPPTDDEREALAKIILNSTYQPAWGECLRAADAVLAANFRRQGPITEESTDSSEIDATGISPITDYTALANELDGFAEGSTSARASLMRDAAKAIRELLLAPVHILTMPDGAAYPCVCPVKADHPFLTVTPEQYVELLLEQQPKLRVDEHGVSIFHRADGTVLRREGDGPWDVVA